MVTGARRSVLYYTWARSGGGGPQCSVIFSDVTRSVLDRTSERSANTASGIDRQTRDMENPLIHKMAPTTAWQLAMPLVEQALVNINAFLQGSLRYLSRLLGVRIFR